MKKISRIISIKYSWPFYIIVISSLILYWKVILLGKVPIPSDITVGMYYPWLDYKWGYTVGVPVKNPILSDVVSVIYPLRLQAIEIIKSGHIPLWTNNMFGGYPLLANFQVAIFSPTIFLYVLFDSYTAWSFQSILQPIISGVCMYLFLRAFNLNKLSSTFGGIVYAYSGFSIIWQQWNAHALTAAFIPLVLYSILKLTEEYKLFFSILLTLSISLLVLSGYPQLLVYTTFSAILLLIIKKSKLNTYLVVGSFAVLGLLLSSIQLIPAIELLVNSQRNSEFLNSDLTLISWKYLISFLSPDYFGNHATANFWGEGNYTNVGHYTGVTTILLSFIAIIKFIKVKWDVRFFSILLFTSIILVVRNPISDYLLSIGFHGSSAASATRIFVIINLSLASLAAIAINDIGRISIKNVLFTTASLLTILLISIAFGFTNSNLIIVRNSILPIIFLTISAILIILNKLTNKKIFLILLSLFVFIELFRFAHKYMSFTDSRLLFPNTPVLEELQDISKNNRVFFSNVIPMNMWLPYSLESFEGYDAVYPKSVSEYIAVGNSGDPNATPMTRHANITNPTSKLFDIANMKYGLFFNENYKFEQPVIPKGYEFIYKDRSVSIYENTNAFPRAFITNEKILDYRLEDLIASEVVLIKEVNSIQYAPNRVEIEAFNDYDNNAYLFLSDTYYPGWTAYVNDKQVEIKKAAHTFRAVPIERGLSKVVFVYNPLSFRIGFIISSITGLFLIALIIKHESSNL